MFGFFNLNKNLTEKLYQKNLAFAVKNTTFSLLEKLYQASIMTLMPEEMAREITRIVLEDLDTELAGIYIFKKETDTLAPLVFSKSDILKQDKNGLAFLSKNIQPVATHGFFKKILYDKEDIVTNNFQEVWKNFVSKEDLENIKTVSHIKNLLGYPLIKGGDAFGVLFLGINRDYNNLGIFEGSSIRSIINAIALLIDKAYLYQGLSVSYEVEKKGRKQLEQAYEIEKKSKQELQKLDQDKNNFMLITQHHLRTPLTAMTWRVKLIEDGFFGKVPKKLQDAIHKFSLSSKVLIRIVDEFLNISQFELGQKVINITKGVNVELMVGDIVKELMAQAQAKKIFLRIQATQEKNPLIEADAIKLSTAITSVIDDAIKYTQQGGVTVTVTVKNTNIQIIIQDTGMGIEKKDLPALFTMLFSRSQKSQEVNVTGKGLGLYLANKIIQAHHGSIWAESLGKGRGSTFYIQLPIEQAL